MRNLIPLSLVAALAACTGSSIPPPVISANPIQTVGSTVASTSVGQTVTQGLQNAEWNLDQAIVVGALPSDDPADACLHSALTQMGIEPGTTTPPAPSFTPKVTDLISGGSVLYILAQQAKAVQGGGITMPVSCEALVGKFVLDAGALGVQVAPQVISAIPLAAMSRAPKK